MLLGQGCPNFRVVTTAELANKRSRSLCTSSFSLLTLRYPFSFSVFFLSNFPLDGMSDQACGHGRSVCGRDQRPREFEGRRNGHREHGRGRGVLQDHRSRHSGRERRADFRSDFRSGRGGVQGPRIHK